MSGTLPPRSAPDRRSLYGLLEGARQRLTSLWGRQVSLRHEEARTLDELLASVAESALAVERAADALRRELAALRQEHGELRTQHTELRRDHAALAARVTALEGARG